MSSQSLYRKYRPQTFSDVVGQEHIEQTIRNALAANRISHAYMFCGPRGTGKTTTARLLAKALLCVEAPTADPCGVCESCCAIAEGTHPDVYELDAASRTGVDNVREEIISRVGFSPTRGRYKVYIIDEVHMLSTAAFNALLKTLEEPPAHVVFIMCTTDPHKVPATIVSRCQRFDFRSLSSSEIEVCLAQICEGEGFGCDPEALELIARRAHGGMRDAITALEQVAVFGNGSVTLPAAENMFGDMGSPELAEVFGLIAARDVAGCFRWVQSISAAGIDVAQVARNMTSYARDLFVSSLGDGLAEVHVSAGDPIELRGIAESLGGSDRIAGLMIALGELSSQLRTAADARLSLEMCLARMAHSRADLTLEGLSERISALESGMAAGIATAPVIAETSSTASAPAASAQGVPSSQVVASASATRGGAARPATQADMATRSRDAVIDMEAVLSDPVALRRVWDGIVAELGTLQGAASSLLGGSRPHGDAARGRIAVELPKDAQFARSMLESGDVHADLMECVQKAFGRKVPVVFSLGAPDLASEAPKPERDVTSASQPVPVQPAPASETSFEAPMHEEVPLEAYGHEAPAEASRPVSASRYESGSDSMETGPGPRPASASAVKPESQSVPDATAASESQPVSATMKSESGSQSLPTETPSESRSATIKVAGAEPDDELAALFAEVFGDGVVFRDPDEDAQH